MNTNLTFHDHKPGALSLQDAVVNGLSKKNKNQLLLNFFMTNVDLSFLIKFVNNQSITPPTIEQSILSENVDEIANLTGEGRILVEPGAGNAVKVRLLLNSLLPSAYVPMDISFDYLKSVATHLVNEYPWLRVHATCVDYTHSLPIPDLVPDGPRLLFFPGSSIGNFERDEAGQFLSMIHEAIGQNGMVLIGVDTKKNETILNAAYNDEAGVTAEFNLNLLLRNPKRTGDGF